MPFRKFITGYNSITEIKYLTIQICHTQTKLKIIFSMIMSVARNDTMKYCIFISCMSWGKHAMIHLHD